MTIRPDRISLDRATGPGMTIIAATVTKPGGRMDVLSGNGDGAGFRIDVPLPRQPNLNGESETEDPLRRFSGPLTE